MRALLPRTFLPFVFLLQLLACAHALAYGGSPVAVLEAAALKGQHAGDLDIIAQRISPEGQLLWENGERSATVSRGDYIETHPAAIPDGAGGIIVAFQAEARTGEHAGDSEIFAQRLDGDGKMLWNDGERSVVVASSDWSETQPVIVPDGAGGAIVVFEQHARSGEYAGDVDIGAQRISPEGRLLWEDGERSATVSSGDYVETHPVAIPDGAGGVIVAFQAEARTGEHAGDSEIFAQRLDAHGKMLWNDGERSVMLASSEWSETDPVIVPDGAGGAIIAHEQHARGGEYAGDVDIGAQRISGDGRLLWHDGERSATVSSGDYIETHAAAIPDGAGGIIVAFQAEARTGEHTGDSEIFAQRLDGDGKMLWNDGERSIIVASSEWSETNPAIVPDGAGGAIIVHEQHARGGEYAGDVDIGAQRISPQGKLLWEDGERSVTVSSGDYMEAHPAAVPDGAGGVTVVLQAEARTGERAGDSEIFAQRLDGDGKMLWNDGERSIAVASSEWSETNPILVQP